MYGFCLAFNLINFKGKKQCVLIISLWNLDLQKENWKKSQKDVLYLSYPVSSGIYTKSVGFTYVSVLVTIHLIKPFPLI